MQCVFNIFLVEFPPFIIWTEYSINMTLERVAQGQIENS